MATYYASVTGDDANSGLSIALAKTFSGCIGLSFAAGDRVIVLNNGVYTLTAMAVGNTSSNDAHFFGASVTGSIDGSMPIIRAGATFSSLVSSSGSQTLFNFKNFIFDGNMSTTGPCVSIGRANGLHVNCGFINSSQGGGQGGAGGAFLVNCYAQNNGGGGFVSSSAVRCIASGNSGDGFWGGRPTYMQCISAFNRGSGFSTAGVSTEGTFMGCIAHGNTGVAGFRVGRHAALINCIATSNTGSGFASYDTSRPATAIGCFASRNTSSQFNSISVQIDCISGGDPMYRDVANLDFSIGDPNSPCYRSGSASPMLIHGSTASDIGLVQRLIPNLVVASASL